MFDRAPDEGGPPAPAAGTSWSHEPGTALVFPRDEGWHSLLPGGWANPSLRTMEWMYTNVHLVDDDGNNVVLFVAYFTQGLRLATIRRFDRDWRLLSEHLGTTMGLLRASAERHDLSLRHPHGRDRWSSLGAPHASRLEVVGDGFQVDLDLRPTKAPYHAGDPGYLPFSHKGWFFYYSLTRMTASGSVTLGRRQPRSLTVRGNAWLDHQWGPFFVTPFRNPRLFEQYEWFSLQMSDGSDLILTSVWTPDGQLPGRDAYGGSGLVRADGSTSRLVGSHRLHRTHFRRDGKTGAIYSAGWRLVAPEWDCDLVIRPRHPDQMTPLATLLPEGSRWSVLNRLAPVVDIWGSFWEGTCEVRGRLEGRQVDGDGFAELVKRYSEPVIDLEPPLVRREGPHVLAVVRWRVKNWDPAAELRYRVRVVSRDGRTVATGDDLELSVFCFPVPRGIEELHEVIVQAHSRDHVLRGEVRAPFASAARSG